MRYRSKPSEIEAVQWTGDNFEEVKQFAEPDGVERVRLSVGVDPAGTEDQEPFYVLHLLAGKDGAQGWVEVPVGHWIVRQPGDLTDHWPVEEDYFAKKYEPVRATDDLDELDKILDRANGEFYDRLMAVIKEGEDMGVIAAVCDTHEGLPMTAAEEHDLEVHGLDRCIPAFRVYGPEHSEPDGCDDSCPGPGSED